MEGVCGFLVGAFVGAGAVLLVVDLCGACVPVRDPRSGALFVEIDEAPYELVRLLGAEEVARDEF